MNIDSLIRKNIRSLQPYSSARDEYKGEKGIMLDANENGVGALLAGKYSRYPDPRQQLLKKQVSRLKMVPVEKIFPGNGSDECIDLLYRCFTEPGQDEVIICPPTYGMYAVAAAINDIRVKEVPLTSGFQLDVPGILKQVNKKTKLAWICSPNNPTGNRMKEKDIRELLDRFGGLVIVDEAYADYSAEKSLIPLLDEYPNLVVLQTFSKAWGMAGLRLGMAFADPAVISVMNKVKPPYNIGTPAQAIMLKILDKKNKVQEAVRQTIRNREELETRLKQINAVEAIFPSDANFLLVRFQRSADLFRYLLARQIVVRDRGKEPGCSGCLRITVGNKREIQILLRAIRAFYQNKGK